MYHNYTNAEVEKMRHLIIKALEILSDEDSELLSPDKIPSDFKIEGKKELNREVHETAINHRLAVNIEHLLRDFNYPDYKVDIEYDRFLNYPKWVDSLNTGNKIKIRPDIIVHKRTDLGHEVPHLLVVEAKKGKIIKKDKDHIKDIMSDSNYQYKFGLLISYYHDPTFINCKLITYTCGNFQEYSFQINIRLG